MAKPNKTLAILPIEPATDFKCEPWLVTDAAGNKVSGSRDFLVAQLHFRVPLDYHFPSGEKVNLVARLIYAEARSAARLPGAEWRNWADLLAVDEALRRRPMMVYLCGGPGADNPPCRVRDMNRWLLRKGYQILYPEYRGCGESDPVTHETLRDKCTDEQKAEYIRLFCQDNIVRDLEAVRMCLAEKMVGAGPEWARCDGAAPRDTRWTILGQSYGGQISLTYMSIHPEGLLEIFLTAGMPPCGIDIDLVFRVLYDKVIKRNKEFYAQYPEDRQVVWETVHLISKIGPRNVSMRGRGFMTAQRLLCLGRQFGTKNGFAQVHELLHRIKEELETTRQLSDATRDEFEEILRVDDRPLFPLLLEQTWASGGPNRWAAERAARHLEGFEYLRRDTKGAYLDPASLHPGGDDDRPLYFCGDAFCRFHYGTHDGLLDLGGVADILAEHDWDCPYDYVSLRKNRVPVYAISFVKDMHLDIGLSSVTAAKVGNIRYFVDEENWHQALRNKPKEILNKLFSMKQEAEAEREAESKLEL